MMVDRLLIISGVSGSNTVNYSSIKNQKVNVCSKCSTNSSWVHQTQIPELLFGTACTTKDLQNILL